MPEKLESGSDYSDDDTGSSSEEEDEVEVERPRFIPKSQRVTILQRDAEELEEIAKEEKRKQMEEERKFKTRSLVAESVAKLSEAEKSETNYDSDSGIPDCDDNLLDNVVEVSRFSASKSQFICIGIMNRMNCIVVV